MLKGHCISCGFFFQRNTDSQTQLDEEMEGIEMDEILDVVKKSIDNCEAFIVHNSSENRREFEDIMINVKEESKRQFEEKINKFEEENRTYIDSVQRTFKESIHTTIGQVQDILVESFQRLESKLKEKDKVIEEQMKELDKLKNTVKELNDR